MTSTSVGVNPFQKSVTDQLACIKPGSHNVYRLDSPEQVLELVAAFASYEHDILMLASTRDDAIEMHSRWSVEVPAAALLLPPNVGEYSIVTKIQRSKTEQTITVLFGDYPDDMLCSLTEGICVIGSFITVRLYAACLTLMQESPAIPVFFAVKND